MQKYQESLKWYYNKSVVSRQLKIRDLVLKNDIQTKDKHGVVEGRAVQRVVNKK
jgi:hypothetical protein